MHSNYDKGRLCVVETRKEFDYIEFKQFVNGRRVESLQEEWAGKWNKDILTYAVLRGTKDIPGDRLERLAMSLALTTYAAEIPIKFDLVSINENPDLRVEFKTPEEESYFADRPSVLAFAYFPAQGSVSGKVVFNDAYVWSLNGIPIDNPQTPQPNDTIKTYNLIHVLIHELGHSLGLKHDTNNNSIDVMDPYYNGKVLELSPNDIIRIRKKYGIRIFKYWSRYERLKNWLHIRKRRF